MKYLIIIAILFASTPVMADDSVKHIEVIQVAQQAGCNAYRELVSQYDWDVNVAMAVMQAESSCNSEVVNWKDNHKVCMGSAGLFQIGCVNAPIEEMQDPNKNIQKAYELYSARGWQPWGAYTNGSYKKYLVN